MKKKKVALTTAATLLLRTFTPGSASAQVVVGCNLPFRFGEIDPRGWGRLQIQPDGNLVTVSGNPLVAVAPQPGRCYIKTGGITPVTRSVKVTFTDQTITMTQGANTAKMEIWRMAKTTTAGSFNQMTFSPTEVSNTVNLYIGGRIQFNNPQVRGSYTGTNRLNANIIP